MFRSILRFFSSKEKLSKSDLDAVVAVKPLEQLMNENKEKFIVDKNGFIHLDLNSEKVQADFRREISKLKNFAV
ncbi:MAG: hypothetical protein ACK5NC_01085 [Vibrio sp.]